MAKLDALLQGEGLFIGGHRGFSARYPENTLLAVWEAIALGVDLVEVDVYLSRDGVPVIAHDYRLERCTPQEGVIDAYTFTELKQMDFGSRRGVQFAGLRLPSLEEFLDMMKAFPGVLMDIDFKVCPTVMETAKTACKLIETEGLLNRCVFNSIDCDVIAYIHDRYGKRTIGAPHFYPWIQNFKSGKHGTFAKLWGICVPWKDLNVDVIKAYGDLGIRIVCTPADTREEAEHAIAMGTTLALCNDPHRCIEIAREKGLR